MMESSRLDRLIRDTLRDASDSDWVPDVAAARATFEDRTEARTNHHRDEPGPPKYHSHLLEPLVAAAVAATVVVGVAAIQDADAHPIQGGPHAGPSLVAPPRSPSRSAGLPSEDPFPRPPAISRAPLRLLADGVAGAPAVGGSAYAGSPFGNPFSEGPPGGGLEPGSVGGVLAPEVEPGTLVPIRIECGYRMMWDAVWVRLLEPPGAWLAGQAVASAELPITRCP